MTSTQAPTRRAVTLRWSLLSLLGLALALSNCAEDGPVGSSCGGDSDCGYGLQCFQPFDDAVAICTIGCEESPCAQGICIDTLHGFVCAAFCNDMVCREGLTCQGAATGEDVCWYPDSNLDALPEGVATGRVEVVEDTNGDGELNPGETAILQVYVDNIGQKSVTGLWAQLDAADEDVDVLSCEVPAFPTWLGCSASCSCQMHAISSIVSAPPGEESNEPVISMLVHIPPAQAVKIEFDLTIHDALGRSWSRSVTVPITEPVGAVFAASTEVLWDSNGDGKVSPGEGGALAVYVKNSGETQVRGLWSRLVSLDPNVIVTACYAGVGSSWIECDAACSCESVVESAKQTLEPMQTGDTPLFRLDFEVSPDAPVEALLLGVEFRDELDAQWVDTVSLDLIAPTASLVVVANELLNDANSDGYLSPAESAMVQVFIQNAGITKAVDVWADLISVSPVVLVEECLVGVGTGWNSCGPDCSCEHALGSAKQHLAPGEVSDVAIFAVKFKLTDDAPTEPVEFNLGLHDGMGNQWSATATVEVYSPNSHIQIDTVTYLDDSNGDGFVSPAEDVTIEVRAKNIGSSKSLGVWAHLSGVSEWTTVKSCFAATEGSFIKCDTDCNCSGIPDSEKQILDAGETNASAILQVNLHTSADSPLEPLPFEVTFGDAFGNVWTDSFVLEIVAINATIQVSSAELWDDTNGDGSLSPGESAKIQIFAKNAGTSTTHGLWAELVSTDDTVTVSTCYSQVGTTWAKCSSGCTCSAVSSLAKQVMEANSIGSAAILRINFELGLDAPVEPLTFNVRFHDVYGNTWDDSFIVDVEKYQADIQVGVSESTDDTNGDGWVSPGESAVLTIYPRNDGSVTALGVWAKLIAVDPVITINSCFVEAEETWVKCSNACSCEGLFDSTLQDLPASSTSNVPILQIHYTVNMGAPTQPVGFGVGFGDTLGLEWTDAVVVEVVDADVDINVGVVAITDDDNDDAELNPGETASISIYPQNVGTVLAMGLWSKLELGEEDFDIDSCYARTGEAWGKCDNSCSCHNVFQNLKQTIEPGVTSEDAILQIDGTLSPGATGPLLFQISFTDQFQNQWNDTFLIEVEDAP